jgi:hypothetical protein
MIDGRIAECLEAHNGVESERASGGENGGETETSQVADRARAGEQFSEEADG